MNVLSKDKQAVVIGALAEGNSIRSIERMTGVHRDTIMRLGVRVGKGCEKVLNEKMRGLNCSRIEVDENWGFIGKKQVNASAAVTVLEIPPVKSAETAVKLAITAHAKSASR
jgi:hypothetical protein